ncbi:hypothetical protein C5S30_01955, partial [ANME-1 cluster archaeon GoMg4]|nr:hypothetical protein [ANME-1 cluster archaeon GoMg4]
LEGDPSIFTLGGWIYYASALSEGMGIVFFVLAIASLILLARNRDKNSLFILVSIAVPYLILTAVSNKGGRYITPVLPILALSTSLFLTQLPSLLSFSERLSKFDWRKVEKGAICLVLLVGVLQLLTVTVGAPHITDEHWLYPAPHAPKIEDWQIDNILETIRDNGGSGNIVVVLPDQSYLNGQSLEFYRLKGGYDFKVYNGVYIGYEAVKSNFDKIKFFTLIEPREHGGVYGDKEEVERD